MRSAIRKRPSYADLIEELDDEVRIPGLAFRIALIIGVALTPAIGLAAAYHFGAVHLVGKAWAYDGVPTPPGKSAGIVIGSRDFFATKGSRLYLDYNAQVNDGYVTIGLSSGNPAIPQTSQKKTVIKRSSCGRLEITAAKTGWHQVYFHQSDKGAARPGAADLSFTARWGYM